MQPTLFFGNMFVFSGIYGLGNYGVKLIGFLLIPLYTRYLSPSDYGVIALVAISGLIGAYQAGMQWGVLPGPDGCTVAHAYVLGSGAQPPAVNCNVVTWSLLGLSLAAYNAIFSLGIAAAGAFLLSRKHAA